MSGAPLTFLKNQIYEDYYKSGLTLEQVFKKYHGYDRGDVGKILGLYELDKEPTNSSRDWGTFPQKWAAVCRRLNPKAWEGR